MPFMPKLRILSGIAALALEFTLQPSIKKPSGPNTSKVVGKTKMKVIFVTFVRSVTYAKLDENGKDNVRMYGLELWTP